MAIKLLSFIKEIRRKYEYFNLFIVRYRLGRSRNVFLSKSAKRRTCARKYQNERRNTGADLFQGAKHRLKRGQCPPAGAKRSLGKRARAGGEKLCRSGRHLPCAVCRFSHQNFRRKKQRIGEQKYGSFTSAYFAIRVFC